MQQKRVGWEVNFSELGFAGSGAHKPRREFKGSALKPFFHVVVRLNGALIVKLNPHIKASVKLMIFVKENIIKSYLGKVCIFLPMVFIMFCITTVYTFV